MADRPPGERPGREELERWLLTEQEAVQRLALPAGLDDLLSLPLTIVQLKCVFVVLAEGTSTGTVLQHRLGLSAATISGVVDRLVDGGYLRRQPNPDDRRVVTLHPTARALAWAEDVAAKLQARTSAVVARLDDDELHHLVLGTAALRRALEAVAAGSRAAADGAQA